MRGVVFAGDRRIEIAEFDDPTPGPREVVVEIRASGMCGSDLRFYRAPPGEALAQFGLRSLSERGIGDDVKIIGGHEPCGVVAAVGSDVGSSAARVGDRVMIYHYSGCMACEHCRTGWIQMCKHGATIYGASAHGGHAEFISVPVETVVPLPEELSFAAGAAIGCGTGTAFGALVRMDVSARDTIAVFGQGPVGRSATQLAAALGAEVIAVDIDGDRAREATGFGAAHTVDSSAEDPLQAIREATGGRGVTKALDASGAGPARVAAVQSTRPWGTVAFVGEGGEVTLEVSRDVIRKQLTIVGSYTFPVTGLADCARFAVEHGVDVDAIFTHRWSLDDAARAYAEFDRQASGKGVFEVSPSRA